MHAGDNFVVAAVDNTRHEDNVPTLQTDWWNYGGLTREVSLIEVPESFIDQFDLHLSRTENSAIEGWVHVMGGQAGIFCRSRDSRIASKDDGFDRRKRAGCSIHFNVKGLERWSPATPKLYKVALRAGNDSLDDLIGFRTIETKGTEILLNGKPIFPARSCGARRGALPHRPRLFRKRCGDSPGLGQGT